MDDDVSSRERSGVPAVDTRALITSLAGSVIVGGTAIGLGILSGEEDAVRRAITTRLDALGHEVRTTVELTTDPGLAAA